MSGIKAEHVPYKGGSQALADLIGNHIGWSSQTLPSTARYMRGETLDRIAVTTVQACPEFPDIPTLKEQGYDLQSSTWFGISGPAGCRRNW